MKQAVWAAETLLKGSDFEPQNPQGEEDKCGYPQLEVYIEVRLPSSPLSSHTDNYCHSPTRQAMNDLFPRKNKAESSKSQKH